MSVGEIRYVATLDANNFRQGAQQVSQQFQQLGNSTENVTQQLEQVPRALDQVKQKSNEVVQTGRSFGQVMKDNVLAVGNIAAGVVGLISQYTSLQRAQNSLARATSIEATMKERIRILTIKLSDATKKYGQDSQEVVAIQNKLNLLMDKYQTQGEKVDLMQQSLNERMADFGLNILPTVIQTGSGLVQVAQGFRNVKPAAEGASVAARGFGISVKTALIGTGIGAILVTLGSLLVAFSQNWWGVRDAVNAVGKALGDMFPALRPLLDVLKEASRLLTGEMPEGTAALTDMGEAFGETAQEAKKFGEVINGQVVRGLETIKNLAFGDKGERKDLLSILGIKGGAKNRFKDTLDDIENVAKKMKGLGQLLDFEFKLPDLEKVFDIPKSVTKKAAFTLADRIRSIGKDTKFKDSFNELAKLIEKDAKKGGKHTGEIVGKFMIDHPALLEAFQGAGLVPPGLLAEIDKQRRQIASDIADDAKWEAAFADERSPQEILDDAWWDKMLPEGGEEPKKLPEVVQDVVLNLKTPDGEQLMPGGITGGLNLHEIVPQYLNQLFNAGAWHNAIQSAMSAGPWVEGIMTDIWNAFATAVGINNIQPIIDLDVDVTNAVDSFFNGLFNAGNWHDAINSTLQAGNYVVGILTDLWNQFTGLFNTTSVPIPKTDTNIESNARTWLGDNIGVPITNAWNSFIDTIKSNEVIKAISIFLADPIGSAMVFVKAISTPTSANPQTDRAAQLQTWFKTNITDPITTEWGKFVEGVKSNPTLQTIANIVNGGIQGLMSLLTPQTAEGQEVDIKIGSPEAITKSFNEMATKISKINSAIASSWSKTMNKNIENTASGISDIVSRFNKMASSISKINFAIAKSWSKTMNKNIENTASAVSRIQKYLNGIKNKDVYVYTHHVDIFGKGGMLSFAKGGILKRAQSGLIETSHGPTTTVLYGDNPGGRETHAFIPHNNPGPTMEHLENMFGRAVNQATSEIVTNLSIKIDGNSIINDTALNKRIRYTVGQNRDRFGPT